MQEAPDRHLVHIAELLVAYSHTPALLAATMHSDSDRVRMGHLADYLAASAVWQHAVEDPVVATTTADAIAALLAQQ